MVFVNSCSKLVFTSELIPPSDFFRILPTRLLAAARLTASGNAAKARTAARRFGISLKFCGFKLSTASTYWAVYPCSRKVPARRSWIKVSNCSVDSFGAWRRLLTKLSKLNWVSEAIPPVFFILSKFPMFPLRWVVFRFLLYLRQFWNLLFLGGKLTCPKLSWGL